MKLFSMFNSFLTSFRTFSSNLNLLISMPLYITSDFSNPSLTYIHCAAAFEHAKKSVAHLLIFSLQKLYIANFAEDLPDTSAL